MDDLLKGLWAVVIVAGGYVCFMLLRGAVSLSGRLIVRAMIPTESQLLQWLQDRATARTLGTDADVIRARRKIDFSGKA